MSRGADSKKINQKTNQKTNDMKRLKDIFEGMMARHEKSRRERRRRTLERVASEEIQVRDRNGKLYICLNGAPLLSLDDVNGDLLDMVRAMRINYVLWHERGGQA